MKGIFTPVIFVLILIAGVASCKKDNPKKNTNDCADGSANFTFLASGHQLTYYYNNGVTTTDTGTTTIGIESDGKFPITNVFSPNNSGTQTGYWWACGMDYYYSFTSDSAEGSHWFISMNSNVGDTWFRVVTSDSVYYQLVSKNASVTTLFLGQTFDSCYEVASYTSNTILLDTIYFKPAEGIVYYNGSLINYELVKKNF